MKSASLPDLSSHEHEPHHGKAMITVDRETEAVELVMECVTCGRFTVTVPLVHLRSSIQMLQTTADQLELPVETSVQVTVNKLEANSLHDIESAHREFESMSVEPPGRTDKSKKSAWGE